MIQKKFVKKFVNVNFKKKIGNKAVKKLDSLAEEYVREILKKASRKADIFGRITLKEQDIDKNQNF